MIGEPEYAFPRNVSSLGIRTRYDVEERRDEARRQHDSPVLTRSSRSRRSHRRTAGGSVRSGSRAEPAGAGPCRDRRRAAQGGRSRERRSGRSRPRRGRAGPRSAMDAAPRRVRQRRSRATGRPAGTRPAPRAASVGTQGVELGGEVGHSLLDRELAFEEVPEVEVELVEEPAQLGEGHLLIRGGRREIGAPLAGHGRVPGPRTSASLVWRSASASWNDDRSALSIASRSSFRVVSTR